jgi:hypothetical protein
MELPSRTPAKDSRKVAEPIVARASASSTVQGRSEISSNCIPILAEKNILTRAVSDMFEEADIAPDDTK